MYPDHTLFRRHIVPSESLPEDDPEDADDAKDDSQGQPGREFPESDAPPISDLHFAQRRHFAVNAPQHVVRTLFALNPMVAVIDGFRWAICGNTVLEPRSFLISTGLALFFLVFGIRYFRRMERTFADVI